MTNAQDVIVHSLASSQALLARYTADLKPEEFMHRCPSKSNCTAWIIGHLALTDRRTLTMFGVTDLPTLPDGFEQRFGRDEAAAMASSFGDVVDLLPLFNRHREALIAVVQNAPPEKLGQSFEKPGRLFQTLGELANFMAVHTAMHAGQITMIRRSLGRPPLV